jgi:hypothetical protein
MLAGTFAMQENSPATLLEGGLAVDTAKAGFYAF